MADECKENQGGNDIQLNISVRKVVKTPACHVVDRGSIPGQRERLDPNTRPHQNTFSTFDKSKFKPEKTWRMIEKNESGYDNQPNMSLSIE